MSCFSELTYSTYVDDELKPDEARAVEVHLIACGRCKALVESLRVESRVLAEVMATEDLVTARGRSLGRSLLLTAASAFAVAGGLDAITTWIGKLLPSAADWVNPLNPGVLWTLFVDAIMYLSREGASMLSTVLETITYVLVVLLVAGALALVLKKRSVSLAILGALAVFLGATSSALAMERRKADRVVVPTSETVDGLLFTNSDLTEIDGVVNGDLVNGSRRLVIKGTVRGDVLTATQEVEIDGTVTGSVYGFAQSLSVRGGIARNLYCYAQNVRLEQSGHVDGDMIEAGGVTNLDGTVGRDVTLGSGVTEMRGKVGRDLLVYTGNLIVGSDAHVGGNLTAHVDKRNQIQIDSGATVGGKTDIILKTHPVPSRYQRPKFYFWRVVSLAAALLTGLVLYWLFPGLFAARLDTVKSVLVRGGVGFLVLVATPIAAVILGFTIIGLPISIVGLLLWAFGLYVAKVFAAAVVGQGIMKSPTDQGGAFALALLVGLFIIYVVTELPYVGGWITFLVLLFGLGIAFMQLISRWRRAPAAA